MDQLPGREAFPPAFRGKATHSNVQPSWALLTDEGMSAFTDVSPRGNLGSALRARLLPGTGLGFADRRLDFGCLFLLGGQADLPRRIGLDHCTLRMDAFPGIGPLSADRAVLALGCGNDRRWLLLAHDSAAFDARYVPRHAASGGLFTVSNGGKSRLRKRIAALKLLRNQQAVVGEFRQRHAEHHDVGTGKTEHLPRTRPEFSKDTQHFQLFRRQRGGLHPWVRTICSALHFLRLRSSRFSEALRFCSISRCRLANVFRSFAMFVVLC